MELKLDSRAWAVDQDAGHLCRAFTAECRPLSSSVLNRALTVGHINPRLPCCPLMSSGTVCNISVWPAVTHKEAPKIYLNRCHFLQLGTRRLEFSSEV